MDVNERLATLEANYKDLHGHLMELKTDVKEIKDALLNCGEKGISQRVSAIEHCLIIYRNILIAIGLALFCIIPTIGKELYIAAHWIIGIL